MSLEASRARAPRKPAAASGMMLLHHGLVGAVLGLPLAVLVSGCLNALLGDGQDPAQYQVAMWSVVPVWVAVISLAFLARTRVRCWLGLLIASAVAAVIFYGIIG